MRTHAVTSLPLLLASTLFLTGCASVLGSKRQAIPLASDPPGASATWNGQEVVTPGSLVVPRKADGIRIRFARPGYTACAVTLERNSRGAYWANMALIPVGIVGGALVGHSAYQGGGWFDVTGGIVGAVVGGVGLPLAAMGVDKASGAAYRHDPGKLTVLLTRSAPDGPMPAPGEEPACVLAGKEKARPDAFVVPATADGSGASPETGLRTPW